MRQAFRACIQPICSPRSPRRHVYRPVRYRSDNINPPVQPFKGFAVDTLDAPLHSIVPRTRTAPTPPTPDELPKTLDEEKLAKARVVFGSRLAGPGERQKAKENAGQHIAGILVPPKPEEPDNCCMSGCVNCVWDLFRDDMEEWAMKSAEARMKVAEQRKEKSRDGMPGHVADSMGEDGGDGEDIPQLDLFEGIPVGIREFMKTEKKLKERHRREGGVRG